MTLLPLQSARNGKATWSEENENGRFRSYTYEELLKRDKLDLDIFWLKDESLDELSNLPSRETIAADISAWS